MGHTHAIISFDVDDTGAGIGIEPCSLEAGRAAVRSYMEDDRLGDVEASPDGLRAEADGGEGIRLVLPLDGDEGGPFFVASFTTVGLAATGLVRGFPTEGAAKAWATLQILRSKAVDAEWQSFGEDAADGTDRLSAVRSAASWRGGPLRIDAVDPDRRVHSVWLV